MTIADDVRGVLSDPKYQPILDELKPALPILLCMTVEKAVGVLNGLAGGDSSAATMELRRTATEPQWAEFSKSVISRGNAEAVKAVENKDFALALLWKLLLAAAPLLL